MDVVFEIDDDEPKTEVVEESKVANTKIRKKKIMSEERKTALREQLSRGRATSKANRLAKQGEKGKVEKVEGVELEHVEPQPIEEPTKPAKPARTRKPYVRKTAYDDTSLRNEISELKEMLKSKQSTKPDMETKPDAQAKPAVETKPEREEQLITPIPSKPIDIPAPIVKKKRSLFGGGVVLNF